MVKISFIIPVYNTEQYLECAYNSLKNQTLTEFEAIFINDGSTDKSGELLAEFARKDERIKVITKENGGVASARNAGLDAAVGKYILFLDPDDWFEKDAARELYDTAERENADIVMFGLTRDYYKSDGEKTHSEISLQHPIGVFRDEPFKAHFDKLAASYMITSKMYRRELIENGKHRFENKNIGEDGLFYISVYAQNPTCVVVSDKAYYHYTINRKSSLSNSYHPERLEDNFYLSEAAEAVIKKWGLENSPMHSSTVKYCTVRDLQLGIKNIAMSGKSLREKHAWLKGVMKQKRVYRAVKDTPLPMAGSRNDMIKLILLKLHMYRTVILISQLNRKG